MRIIVDVQDLQPGRASAYTVASYVRAVLKLGLASRVTSYVAHPVTGHGRVLVVDDQPQVLSMLREVVEHLGYEPSTAASGEQAIAAMATVRPHVVFLDLLMPGITGVEVLNYVREHHPTVPVIVITGNIDQEIALRAGAAGAFAVVGKPINLDALKVLAALAMSLAQRT